MRIFLVKFEAALAKKWIIFYRLIDLDSLLLEIIQRRIDFVFLIFRRCGIAHVKGLFFQMRIIMSSTPQSTGSLTPMSHNISDTSWVHENSKCEPPDPLELDSQSNFVDSKESIRSRSDVLTAPPLLLLTGWPLRLLLFSLLLLAAAIPKKSVMDSKSAKWVSSVVVVCSVALLLAAMVLTFVTVVAVIPLVALSWPLKRKLVVKGSITDLASLAAVADCSKKLETTLGSVCRMTSGGVTPWGFWGCRGWGCTVGVLAPSWLTRIEVKSAVDAATVGRTWAEIKEGKFNYILKSEKIWFLLIKFRLKYKYLDVNIIVDRTTKQTCVNNLIS